MQKRWQNYPVTYRATEAKTIAAWISAKESGSVVGLSGSGRSNLLGFLCSRPDVLKSYLSDKANPIAMIPVDIYNLPTNDLSSLYRTILHAFYWVRTDFDSALQETITQLYLENRAQQDPFLPQRALYDLLLEFQNRQTQVVLVLNRFDRFCQTATPQMLNTLRGLRDNFKDTLSYLAGMLQEVMYLPDPAVLGDMYELLDSHVCWVGTLSQNDAYDMLTKFTKSTPPIPTEGDMAAMLALSGCFPVLIRAVGTWWTQMSNPPADIDQWAAQLLQETNVQYRLQRIWDGLTQEEQLTLSQIQNLHAQAHPINHSFPKHLAKSYQLLSQEQLYVLTQLEAKGVCHPAKGGWWITGHLFFTYLSQMQTKARGKIWLNHTAKAVYQGQTVIQNLTPLEYNILSFLTQHPRTKHTRDTIIDNAWPDEELREGITPNALQAHITGLRKKIEQNTSKPRYLITWHGRPGGYQFFPEGKPVEG